jgi:hypothetical protein
VCNILGGELKLLAENKALCHSVVSFPGLMVTLWRCRVGTTDEVIAGRGRWGRMEIGSTRRNIPAVRVGVSSACDGPMQEDSLAC